MVVHNQEEMGEGSAIPTDPHHTPTFIQPSPQPLMTQKPRRPKKKDTRYNTLRNGEDSLKLNELIKLCTNLKQRVLDLEKIKTTQAEEIFSLKRRVKKREQKKRSRTHRLKRFYKVGLTTRVESSGDEESLGEDASKQGRINAIDADEDITLVNDQDDADMFDVNTLTALAALKSVKPKVKSNVIEDPSISVSDVSASTKVSAATTTTATILILRKGIIIDELGTSTTTTISSQTSQAKVQDKGKGILVEEPVKPKKKDRIRLDEEIASKLQAEFDEEERLAREKDKANAQEQEELTDEEKARLFVQFLKQRRKHFAAKRAEEKRNKPPTQAQQRKIMCTYLKNMEGKKPKDLKNKSFDSIQKMFDRAFKRVNTFVDFKTDLVEGSSKRADTKLEQEVTKKQKVDDVQETAEMDNDQEAAKIKELMKIVPNKEEVAIDGIPLAIKPQSIVDWKIHKEGKKTYYQMIRADGSSKMYLIFSHMLKIFDREDLETLWKLIKAKHRSIRLEEGYERVLWGDLKVIFEPNVEDTLWRNQQDYRVLEWKLYDSCGVHFLRMQHMHIYMLVENKYHPTPATITDMLNKKLQCDHFSEIAYQLL
ncbi:hypothetical protein Tco_1036389 [Tanacetum coccineum]